MAKKFVMGFETPGFSKLLENFDKLDRKEQMAIVRGSKLGGVLDKIERKGKKAGKSGESSFGAMSKQLQATFDVTSILRMGLNRVNQELERTKQLQREAADGQRTYADAVAQFANNNRGIRREELAQVERFAKAQGQMLGAGGAAEVMRAVADVSGNVGTGFAQTQVQAAVEQQVRLKSGEGGKFGGLSGINIAESATANLLLQKQAGISGRQAENVISQFSKIAKGNATDFMSQMPGVMRSAKDPMEGVALLGFLSQQTQLDAPASGSLARNVLGKTFQMNMSRAGVKLQGDSQLDQFVNLMKQANEGKFGKKTMRVLSTAGLEGSMASAVMRSVANNEGQLRNDLALVRGGVNTPRDLAFDTLRALPEQSKISARRGRIAGTGDVAQIEDVESARRQAVLDEYRQLRKRQGLGVDSSTESLISRGMIGSTQARTLSSAGVIDRLLPGATEQQQQTRDLVDQFVMAIRKAQVDPEIPIPNKTFDQFVDELKRLNVNVEKKLEEKDVKVLPEGE